MNLWIIMNLGLILFVCGSCSAFKKICSSYNSSYTGPKLKLPQLPLNFTTLIEENILNKNLSMEITEYYDKNSNKGAKVYYLSGHRIKIISDFNSDEIIRVNETSGNCTVVKMEAARFNVFDLFTTDGYQIKSGSNFSETYKGTQYIRGIRCNHWEICINDNQTSYYAHYYFSTPEWKTSSGMTSILVRAAVNGISTRAVRASSNQFESSRINATYNFSHVYDFFSFTPGLPKSSAFQVPPGTICSGNVTNHNLPKMPDEFENNVEFVNPRSKMVSNARYYIDTKEGLVRIDHISNKTQPPNPTPVMVVHDYGTGLKYKINRNTLDCGITLLTNRSREASTDDPTHKIRIKTSEELLFMNNNYTYEGVATVRGITTDVFIASNVKQRRRGSSSMMTETVRYYFSRPSWNLQSVGIAAPETQLPVQMKTYTENDTFTISFFNFDHAEPANHIMWPLRYCYWNNRHYMYFRLNGSYADYARTNERGLLSALRTAIAEVGNISKLRVSTLLIFKSVYGGVIAARLYILGVPELVNPNLLHPKHTIPLKDALNLIKKAIKAGKVNIRFQQRNGTSYLAVQPNSYFDNDVRDKHTVAPKHIKYDGLHPGQVIAISVGVIIGAVLLTVLCIHFLMKRRGINMFHYIRHRDTEMN